MRIKARHNGPYTIRAAEESDDESLVIGADETVAEVLIYGPIGEGFLFEETVSAREFVRDIADLDADRIIVRINSEGGSVPDGIAIHNALRRHAAQVDVEIDGMALSIASTIAMAGDNVRMANNALMMLHAPSALCLGNARDMRQQADMLDHWSQAMTQAYLRVVGDENEVMINGLLTDGEDHWFTAAEAESAGLVTDVTDGVAIAAHYDFRHIDSKSIPAAASAYDKRNAPVGDPTQKGGRTKTRPNEHDDKPSASTANQPTGSQGAGAQPTAGGDVIATFKTNESARRREIRARFQPFAGYSGVSDLEARCLDDMDISANAAADKLLNHLGEGAEPLAASQQDPIVEMGEDAVDKRRAAKTQALMSRMGVNADTDGQPFDLNGNAYRGQTLGEMARASLEEAGVNVRGQSNHEIAEQALSYYVMAAGGQTTSDFPVILENTMHKIMVGAFNATPITFDQFCKIGTVSDFRPWRRLVPGLMGGFDRKNEAGEYVNKNVPDAEGQSISAEEYGNIITIDRRVLINDDIAYINDMAQGLGMAGRRGIESTVFQVLAMNPKMEDGNKLFSAAHNNLAATGAAPSADTLTALADMMREQKAPGSDQVPLDIAPSVALARHTTARDIQAINDAPYAPDQELSLQIPNKARGLFQSVVGTPRIQGSEYYALAPVTVAPVIEVVFLNGQQLPALVQQEVFRTGSLQWRASHDYGVGAIDYRGAAKNPGASG